MNAHTMTHAELLSRPMFVQPSSAGAPPLPGWEIQLAESNLTELVTRIAHKDEAALEALYSLSISRVYGLAIRITRQRAAAEELAEDVYMQVWN